MSNLNSFITPEKGKKQQKDHVEIKKKRKKMDVSFFDLLEERLAKGKNKNKAQGLHQLWKGSKLSNSTTIISCTNCTPDKLSIIFKFEQDELLIATILKEIYDIKTDTVIDHQFLSLISNFYIIPIIGCSCYVESFEVHIYIRG